MVLVAIADSAGLTIGRSAVSAASGTCLMFLIEERYSACVSIMLKHAHSDDVLFNVPMSCEAKGFANSSCAFVFISVM